MTEALDRIRASNRRAGRPDAIRRPGALRAMVTLASDPGITSSKAAVASAAASEDVSDPDSAGGPVRAASASQDARR